MASSIGEYHKLRSALLALLGGRCVRCGSCDKLQFHHNDGKEHGSHNIGGWQQLIKLRREIRRRKPIILLCPGCHRAVHEQGGIWKGD